MTRHLQKCGQTAPPQSGPVDFHLFVEGRYDKDYWMHISLSSSATLDTLDAFLRRAWLECCGHLSAFTIGGQSYSMNPMREHGDFGMSAKLERVLEPGVAFRYEYDFGSTTDLNLKVVGVRARAKGRGVALLARNEPPQVDCNKCGLRPATQICSQCLYQGTGWLCDECAADHPCGEDMFLPVLNSPRVGVCAYGG